MGSSPSPRGTGGNGPSKTALLPPEGRSPCLKQPSSFASDFPGPPASCQTLPSAQQLRAAPLRARWDVLPPECVRTGTRSSHLPSGSCSSPVLRAERMRTPLSESEAELPSEKLEWGEGDKGGTCKRFFNSKKNRKLVQERK